jgi:hypothetical protein
MRKPLRIPGILVLLVCVSGCPDGPPQILRDELNAASEVSDYLSKVTDEDSAKIALSVMKRLKERWDSIKKRREGYKKMASDPENLQFTIYQDPDVIRPLLDPPVDEVVEKVFASATALYKKELTACARRLDDDGKRVRLLNIADPNVFNEIQQFEKKVFGDSLKMPELPMQIPDRKKLNALVKRAKDELSGSMGGNSSAIILFIALGVVIAGGAIVFIFRK